MKMRQRKDMVFTGASVSVEGRRVKTFHTHASARQFVHVMRRLSYSDEEWERHQRTLEFFKLIERQGAKYE